MPQADDDFAPRRYRVRHRTAYTYDAEVAGCYERGFLRPRETPTQRVVSHALSVSPEPLVVAHHIDWLGNRSHYVEVRTPYRRLEVVKESVVDVAWPRADLAALDRWSVGESAALLRKAADDPLLHAAATLPSRYVGDHPEVATYARGHVDEAMPLGRAIAALLHGVHADFAFRAGVTSVRTTLPELLALRAGVCQDFTHLTLGCLRALGLPARYVSGYIETLPPPGQPKLEGSDASHAWVSVQVPGGAWVDLDPTNDHLADSRYVVTAWGRDFGDVSPLKGIVDTGSHEAVGSTLEVGVDVVRLSEPAAEL